MHSETLSTINKYLPRFPVEMQSDIEDLLNLVTEYSPLSDLNYILHKRGKQLKSIKLPYEPTWLPLRNVLRIIAQLCQYLDVTGISEVQIHSMICGCDYFEGEIQVNTPNTILLKGQYRWQWTAFPGKPRSFDRFSVFPKLISTEIANENN